MRKKHLAEQIFLRTDFLVPVLLVQLAVSKKLCYDLFVMILK